MYFLKLHHCGEQSRVCQPRGPADPGHYGETGQAVGYGTHPQFSLTRYHQWGPPAQARKSYNGSNVLLFHSFCTEIFCNFSIELPSAQSFKIKSADK